jgi:hypothetical protein
VAHPFHSRADAYGAPAESPAETEGSAAIAAAEIPVLLMH